MTRPASLSMVAALVLLLATVVFVIGTRTERSLAGENGAIGSDERPTALRAENITEPPAEGSDVHEEGEVAEAPADAVTAQEAAKGDGEGGRTEDAVMPHNEVTETSQTILGINPESTSAIAAAVVISLILAAALWFRRTPAVLIVAAVFTLLFAALDLREFAHQLGEARSNLAGIAIVAAVLHIAVAVIAGLALTRGDASVGTPSLV